MKVRSCLYCGNKKLEHVTHRLDEVGILKCSRCGVMMVDAISDDTEKLYTAEYFEKEQGTKNGYTNYLSSPVANLIGKYAFSRLFTPDVGRHLDLGCADGSLMEIFKSEGFATSGLEISRDAVKIANTKGLDVSFSRLHSFPGNLEKSDVITAFDLLEHADKPGAVLKEVYNNLKEGGHFVFSTLSVKKDDPSDYWYNNSLEHYVYYNTQSLQFILAEVFGEGNFDFVEMEINGIAEFWGFGKKGKENGEKRLMDIIKTSSYDRKDASSGYLLSLFYNQVSKFDVSSEIIEHFKDKWTPGQFIEAKFYNNYYQGRLEIAVNESKTNSYLLSATSSVYWQALADAETKLHSIKRQDLLHESAEQILNLREQLFRVKDELHALRNSRVVGRIIKARDTVVGAHYRIRSQVSRLKRAPRKVYHVLKPRVAKVTPGPVRRAIMKVVRYDYSQKRVETTVIDNETWQKDSPLVTVVIPYYNRADTIDDTISSLLLQTFKNFEVILVDDGSTEKASIKKLKKLEYGNLNLQVVSQKNQGVAAARNNGTKLARGRYVICLDSDDMIEPTFIEKSIVIMESDPEVSLVTSYMEIFGVKHETFHHASYNPLNLYKNNMVITGALFRKEAWAASGGYRSGIGYEDWEFWISLAEHGFWGRLIPEELFKYRTSMQSRYVEDKDVHWNNLKQIRALHPDYKVRVKKLLQRRWASRRIVSKETALVNLNDASLYARPDNENKNILIVVPWMTFGGAETLISNFSTEIADKYNLSFITGLKSANEWEYKFKKITPNVYHLPNLFIDEGMYSDFVSNYIETRSIDVLHVIHTNYVFGMLEDIKRRHPRLKIIVTMFNDRVPEYFRPSIALQELVDVYTTDNTATAKHYKQDLTRPVPVVTIPNGIDCYDIYNPKLFDRQSQRAELGLEDKDIAVFFVGRLSEEKNPDVFVKVAERIIKSQKAKNVQFYIIGDGGMRQSIEKSIAEIGSRSIRYLGYQSEVGKYMNAADIFVLPSSIEGFPLSILEAMAMNLAVIASDVGAVRDVLTNKKDGYVVTPGSVEEIAEAIHMLYSNPRVLGKIKAAARETVEKNFSNVTLRQNYLNLYRSVIK